jgi:hypothetical protein
VEFSFSVSTGLGTGTSFPYEIPPGGVWKMQTLGTPSAPLTGYARIVPAAGHSIPAGAAILKQFTGTNLNFEAGVPAAAELSRAMMFGFRSGSFRSAIAMVSRSAATVRVTALDADGRAVTPAKTISISANGRLAAFLDELVPEVPAGFKGSAMIEAASPVALISLRTTVNTSGAFLMTVTPILNLDRPPGPETGYFPLFADGGGFATEFLVLNPAAATARLQFFNPGGQPLAVPLR